MAANEENETDKRLRLQELDAALREGDLAIFHNARYDEMLNAYRWLPAVIILLIGGWVWDHNRQADRYDTDMAAWCPYWSPESGLCEIN